MMAAVREEKDEALEDAGLPALPKRGAVAYSQYPRQSTPCGGGVPDCGYPHVMGYTLRTSEWRYTEWVAYDNATFTPQWEKNKADIQVELYSHAFDSGANWTSYETSENGNVASDPAYSDVVKYLSSLLHCSPGLLEPKTPCPAPPTS